jgi:transcription initiation factor IIE alpha subunit
MNLKCLIGKHEWYIIKEYPKENAYNFVCPHCGKLLTYMPNEFFKRFNRGKVKLDETDKRFIIENFERY